MREIQKSKLSPRVERMGAALKWEDDVNDLEECEWERPRLTVRR